MNLPSAEHPFLYEIFGRLIASGIELPELAGAAGGEPHWSFTVDHSLPERPDGPLLGEDPLYDDIVARLYEAPDGGRWIHVADTGTFHISADTHRIRWRPNPDPWWDFGRGHLMGRVLATAMHMEGILTLHGSAVVAEGRAIAFLAPKFSGKSTLALALTRAGARLLTDDSLPVTLAPDGPVLACPGVHSVRLTLESRRALDIRPDAEPNREGKVVIPDPVPGRTARDPAPLSAIYFVTPEESTPGCPAIRRDRLGSVEGTLLLQGQTKIGAMLGPSAAGDLLNRSAAVVARVPTWRLRVVRDFNRLDEVVEGLMDRHLAPAAHGGPRGDR